MPPGTRPGASARPLDPAQSGPPRRTTWRPRLGCQFFPWPSRARHAPLGILDRPPRPPRSSPRPLRAARVRQGRRPSCSERRLIGDPAWPPRQNSAQPPHDRRPRRGTPRRPCAQRRWRDRCARPRHTPGGRPGSRRARRGNPPSRSVSWRRGGASRRACRTRATRPCDRPWPPGRRPSCGNPSTWAACAAPCQCSRSRRSGRRPLPGMRPCLGTSRRYWDRRRCRRGSCRCRACPPACHSNRLRACLRRASRPGRCAFLRGRPQCRRAWQGFQAGRREAARHFRPPASAGWQMARPAPGGAHCFVLQCRHSAALCVRKRADALGARGRAVHGAL